MAGPFYVDDGGSSTSAYDTWAKAASDLFVLDTAIAFTYDEFIYIGHDSATAAASGNKDVNVVTDGRPTILVSMTQGGSSYQKSSTDQVACTGILQFVGSMAAYGVQFSTGVDFSLYTQVAGDIIQSFKDCNIKLGVNGKIRSYETDGKNVLIDCTIDLTADGTTARATPIISPQSYSSGGTWVLTNPTFVNPGYRSTYLIEPRGRSTMYITGGDWSGFTNASAKLLYGNHGSVVYWSNSKLPATWTPFDANFPLGGGRMMISDCGNTAALAKGQLAYRDTAGTIQSSQSIYRTGGAEIEGQVIGWLCTTRATYCTPDVPHTTPWGYGVLDSTGSKTFKQYVTNDTADFTDRDVRLEIQYKSVASGNRWVSLSDAPADRLASAVNQTTDSSSTWNGSGPSFTYKQELSVTATVNTTGTYRFRTVVTKANILSSAYFYIDPKVTVT